MQVNLGLDMNSALQYKRFDMPLMYSGLILKIINCRKIIGVRKAFFSVKIYITLGYIYIKIYGLLP